MWLSSSSTQFVHSRPGQTKLIFGALMGLHLMAQESMPNSRPDAVPGRFVLVSVSTASQPGATIMVGDIFKVTGT